MIIEMISRLQLDVPEAYSLVMSNWEIATDSDKIYLLKLILRGRNLYLSIFQDLKDAEKIQ